MLKLTQAQLHEDLELLGVYIKRWRKYALSFHIEACQAEKFGTWPTFQQYELCNLRDKYKFIAIAAARGVGKTSWEVKEVFRHQLCFKEPGMPVKVPITGPSGGQLADVIWAEISSVHEQLLPWLKSRFVINEDGMYCVENPRNWFASPRTARKENPQSMLGQHGSTLNVYDEASGIPDEIYRVSLASMTQKTAYAIMAGNPDKLSGYFYRVFNKIKDGGRWARYFIDAFDCKVEDVREYPYIDPMGEEHIIRVPGLIEQQWFEDQKGDLGEGSPLWEAYVRGRFPSDERQTFIKKTWVERGWTSEKKPQPNRFRILAADPGFQVDPSGIVIREGLNIEQALLFHGMDPHTLAKVIEDIFDNHRKAGKQIRWIVVDDNGIGSGCKTILQADGYPVIGVKSQESAPKWGVPCRRTRDWLGWQCMSWFRDNHVHFEERSAEMEQLAEECRIIQRKPNEGGKVVLESKIDMQKRGHKSPNLWDALNLTFKVDHIYRAQEEKKKIDPYRKKIYGDRYNSERSWKTI